MNFPIYYNKDEVNFNTFGEAILENAYDIRISQKLNDQYTLDFNAPLDEKTQNINEGFFKVEDTIFIIKKVTISKQDSGQKIVNFDCEHIYFDLINEYIEEIPSNFTTGRTLYDVLNFALGNYYMIRYTVDGTFTANVPTTNYYRINFSVPGVSSSYNFNVVFPGSATQPIVYNKYAIVEKIVDSVNLDASNPYRAIIDQDNTEYFYFVSKVTGERIGNITVTYTNISGVTIRNNVLINVSNRFIASTNSAEKTIMESAPFNQIDFLKLEKKNSVEIITELIERFDLELKLYNLPNVNGKFMVALYPKDGLGINTGVQFRYRKNIKNISRIIDNTTQITKLYVYGNNKILMTKAPKNTSGKDFFEVPGVTKHKVGYVEFNELTTEGLTNQADINKILDKLYDQGLQYFNKVKFPELTYEIGIVELKDFVEYGSLESFSLGDTIKVIDEDIGVNNDFRIVEYQRYPLEPEQSSVSLSTVQKQIKDYFTNLTKAKDTVARTTTTGTQKVVTKKVLGPIAPKDNEIVYFNTTVETETIKFDENGLKGQKKLPNGTLSTSFHITPEGDANFSGTVTASRLVAPQIEGGTIEADELIIQDGGAIKIELPNNNAYLRIDENGMNVVNPAYWTTISRATNTIDNNTTLKVSQNGNLTIRGAIEAGSFRVPLNNTGTTSAILIDKEGMEVRNSAGVKTVDIDSNGNATFRGTVTASTITGSVVNGSTINGAEINITSTEGSFNVPFTFNNPADPGGPDLTGTLTITGQSFPFPGFEDGLINFKSTNILQAPSASNGWVATETKYQVKKYGDVDMENSTFELRTTNTVNDPDLTNISFPDSFFLIKPIFLKDGYTTLVPLSIHKVGINSFLSGSNFNNLFYESGIAQGPSTNMLTYGEPISTTNMFGNIGITLYNTSPNRNNSMFYNNGSSGNRFGLMRDGVQPAGWVSGETGRSAATSLQHNLTGSDGNGWLYNVGEDIYIGTINRSETNTTANTTQKIHFFHKRACTPITTNPFVPSQGDTIVDFGNGKIQNVFEINESIRIFDDVKYPSTPQDGWVLKWSSAENAWIPSPP